MCYCSLEMIKINSLYNSPNRFQIEWASYWIERHYHFIGIKNKKEINMFMCVFNLSAVHNIDTKIVFNNSLNFLIPAITIRNVIVC